MLLQQNLHTTIGEMLQFHIVIYNYDNYVKRKLYKRKRIKRIKVHDESLSYQITKFTNITSRNFFFFWGGGGQKDNTKGKRYT